MKGKPKWQKPDVIFQKVFNEGVHWTAVGGNAMRLRVHLEKRLRTPLLIGPMGGKLVTFTPLEGE